ncbi:MAG: hypothetical protein QOF32_2035 [Gammaproteobacteria bacterium]|jgi:hypothetical protein|nr:hypothetical protein [Gammaproteobacteria bacterium]
MIVRQGGGLGEEKRGVAIMRITLLVSAIIMAGCAGQPNAPSPDARYVTASGQPVDQIQLSTPDGDVNAKRLADAKKRGYTLVNTDGETMYCRSDLKTGSRIQRDTVCLTASELDALHDQTRRSLENVKVTPPLAGH